MVKTSQYRLPISHIEVVHYCRVWIRLGLGKARFDALWFNDKSVLGPKLAVTLKAPIYQIRNVKAGDFISFDIVTNLKMIHV